MDKGETMKAIAHDSEQTTKSSLKWMRITFLTLLMSCHTQHSLATVVLQSFEGDSLSRIEQERKGEAFILVLWSIDCPPCFKELKLLNRLKDSGLSSRLILVSTDGEESRDELERVIQAEQLSAYQHWFFDGALAERLRFRIDPLWYGELPRAYFYDEQGDRVPQSGLLTETVLRAWLTKYSQAK